MFVFTIDDVDFVNKTVEGNLITKEGVENSIVPIPEIIFNLTYHKKRSSRKNVRKLALHPSVIIINEANRFRQYMIMEMLSSHTRAKYILLKHEMYIREDSAKNRESLFTLNKGSDKQKFIMSNKPDLLSYDGHPIIFTVYAQRGIEGLWKVLPKPHRPEGIVWSDALNIKLSLAAIESSDWISHFIPCLGISTVNFVLDKYSNPYVVRLDGLSSKILDENDDNITGIEFMKNLYDYTNFLRTKQQGGANFVG